MSITINNVTKIYGNQKALDNISIDISNGEVVGLLGPNGAGKSTLMKILTSFLPPTSGSAKVCGFDVVSESMDVKKKVGYLPEHNPLYLDMYVKEYLQFIAGIHNEANPDNRIKQMIDMCGLGIEQHKKIGALSKGFRQRIGLAQALFHDPEVLILDEPTSGLDPNHLIEIRGLIKEIGESKTILISTHIMQEVDAVCDRVVIINKGKLATDDTTKNLHQTDSENIIITVEFNNDINQSEFRHLDGILKLENIDTNSWRILANNDIRDQIFQYAVAQNISVLSMQKEEQSLEQIFQNLTK